MTAYQPHTHTHCHQSLTNSPLHGQTWCQWYKRGSKHTDCISPSQLESQSTIDVLKSDFETFHIVHSSVTGEKTRANTATAMMPAITAQSLTKHPTAATQMRSIHWKTNMPACKNKSKGCSYSMIQVLNGEALCLT